MVSLTITLHSPEKPNYQWGSSFHGMLMSLLPQDTAAFLHEDGQKLLSQWLEPVSDDKLAWHIHVLDDDLAGVVMQAIAEAPSLYSRDRRAAFPVLRADCVQKNEIDFAETMLAAPARKGVGLEICTPATHKSGGRYVTLPTVELICRSLTQRLSALWPGLLFPDEETASQLVSLVSVGRYGLRSAVYGVGGSYAMGYMGHLEFRFSGDDLKQRLLHALFAFAPWFGIGAKTSLGMGGCRLRDANERL